MQLSANKQIQIKTHYEIVRVVDGDGLIVKNTFTHSEEEIRLLGIDAPEIKKCRKLIEDEKQTHLPGSFLIELGYIAFEFLRRMAEPKTKITIIQESKNLTDRFGRTLAYVILPNGNSLNEIVLKNGYARPYDKVYCSELAYYQKLNFNARTSRQGLYSLTERF